MIPRILDALYLRDYTIRLRFSDGTEGEVDLKSDLDGPIFAPLKDLDYFRRFTLHPEFHTLTWPNGADLAPEFLYDKVQVSVV